MNLIQLLFSDFECADQYSSDCENAQTLYTLAIFLKLISSLVMVIFAFKKGSIKGKGCIAHALILQILSSFVYVFVRPLAYPDDTSVDIYGTDILETNTQKYWLNLIMLVPKLAFLLYLVKQARLYAKSGMHQSDNYTKN